MNSSALSGHCLDVHPWRRTISDPTTSPRCGSTHTYSTSNTSMKSWDDLSGLTGTLRKDRITNRTLRRLMIVDNVMGKIGRYLEA